MVDRGVTRRPAQWYDGLHIGGAPDVHLSKAGETQNGLELTNGVDITVATNDFRAVRGRSILCAILDEVAFFRDETSATPDAETYAALKPGLMTLKGTLIGISSPYRRSGLLFQKWKEFYGKNDSNTLVIRASRITMNPTLDQAEIDAAIAEDPAKASAEYLAEWRSDIEGVFTQEAPRAKAQSACQQGRSPGATNRSFS